MSDITIKYENLRKMITDINNVISSLVLCNESFNEDEHTLFIQFYNMIKDKELYFFDQMDIYTRLSLIHNDIDKSAFNSIKKNLKKKK